MNYTSYPSCAKSPDVAKVVDILVGSKLGSTALHASFEAYIGAALFPGTPNTSRDRYNYQYEMSHNVAKLFDSDYKEMNFGIRRGVSDKNEKGKVIEENVIFYDLKTGTILHDFGIIKY